MLYFGRNHGVGGAEVGPPPAVGHEVYGLGGVLGEDDLVGRRGAYEGGYLRPGPLIKVGRLLGDLVDVYKRQTTTCNHLGSSERG